MKNLIFILFTIILSTIAIVSCSPSIPSSEDDIHMYTFDQSDGSMTPTQEPPTPNHPVPNISDSQKYVRNEVVTEQNSVFSIGIPANHTEKTEVIAQKPVNFWFEYVPDDMQLKVDNQIVQRDPTQWELKLRFTENVTKFKYEARNNGSGMMSYNLHIVPANAGESIPVTVTQQYEPN
jgi:hypothetical protein